MENLSLKKVLLFNAVFSIMCAIDLLIFTSLIAEYMGGFSPVILQVVGIGLLPFAGFVIWVALKTNDPKWVKEIVFMDRSWVLGSIGVLVFALSYLSLAGITIIMIIALIVAAFGETQNRLLNQTHQIA